MTRKIGLLFFINLFPFVYVGLPAFIVSIKKMKNEELVVLTPYT